MNSVYVHLSPLLTFIAQPFSFQPYQEQNYFLLVRENWIFNFLEILTFRDSYKYTKFSLYIRGSWTRDISGKCDAIDHKRVYIHNLIGRIKHSVKLTRSPNIRFTLSIRVRVTRDTLPPMLMTNEVVDTIARAREGWRTDRYFISDLQAVINRVNGATLWGRSTM